MGNATVPRDLRLEQFLSSLVVHGIWCLAAPYSMLALSLLGGIEQRTPSVLFVLVGFIHWLGGGLLVWYLWGRRARTVVPIFASTLGMLLLVSSNLALEWTLPGINLVMQDFVHCLLLSTLPITVSWLVVGGPRWRAVVVNAAALLTVVAGIIVRFMLPDYDSVARFLFRW